MHSVSLAKTRELERIDLCVCVTRAIEVGLIECHNFLIILHIVSSGNGVQGCTPGDCISLRHEMCPNNRACYDSTCVGNEIINVQSEQSETGHSKTLTRNISVKNASNWTTKYCFELKMSLVVQFDAFLTELSLVKDY